MSEATRAGKERTHGGDQPAYPQSQQTPHSGLTKREDFAKHINSQMWSNLNPVEVDEDTIKQMAKQSVIAADSLLMALNAEVFETSERR